MHLKKFSISTLCLAAALCVGMAGCKSNNPDSADAATDPADINNAAPTDQTQATDQTAQTPQEAAPEPSEPRRHHESAGTEEQAPQENYQAAPTDTGYGTGYDQGYEAGIQAQQPPPPLPEYQQPECPQPNYLWTPGYWHYASAGYYWVPGVWVAPPYTGALWTPGYWGFVGGFYRFHQGYWGAHIGYYGGIPYGHGYNGEGFYGGYWNHGNFTYNTTVTRVNTTIITNTYTHNVTNIYNNNTYTHISYNGGQGGLQVRPTPAQIAVMHEPHVNPLPQQIQHREEAQQNRAQYVTANGGHPAVLVAAKPIELAHVNPSPALVNPGFRGETARPAPAMASRPVENRPAPAANGGSMRGPEPANHPAEGRPAEVARPEPGHPAREARPAAPAARPEAHPAPQPHATERPAEHPAPQAHPATQQHPAARPVEHPAVKPKPEAHPEEKKKPEEPR